MNPELNNQELLLDNAGDVSWEDFEYDHFEKGADWYILLGAIAFLLVVIAVMLGDMLLVLIIILGALILGFYGRREPSIINFALTRDGVKVGRELYPYSTINSFWIDYERGKLIIESSRIIKPHLVIPIANTDPDMVRDRLLKDVAEVRHEGTFTEIISEFFGF